MKKLVKWGRNNFFKVICFVSSLLYTPMLFAAEGDKEPKEQVWVMSWAMFIFFIGMMIGILAHSKTRLETRLTGEDKKQNEEELANKIEALRLEEKKRRRLERQRRDE